MITMRIRVKGPLRIVTGNELTISLKEIKGNKVRDLAEFFKRKFSFKARKEDMEEVLNDFFSHNVVVVNGLDISVLNDEDTELNENDEILIINITHGG